MKQKEALDILKVKQSHLSALHRRGIIRAERLSTRRYDYNEEDVRRTAQRLREKRPIRPTGVQCDPSDIARKIGFDIEQLRSPSVKRELADQRRIMAKVLAWLGMDQCSIGKALNRNHSSVNVMLKTAYLVEEETHRIITQLTELGYGKETTQEL